MSFFIYFSIFKIIVPYLQYLSMIWGLYDNSIVAYKTGTEQTVNLVLNTIRLALRKAKKRVAAELLLHSDQGGFQYTSITFCQIKI